MLPWIAGGLGDSKVGFSLSFIAFLASNIALALRWNTASRVPLTWITLVMGVVTYAITRQALF